MKTAFRLILLMAVPLWAQSSVVFTWSHNPLKGGTWPVCRKSVTTFCQTGYTLTDVTTASAPVVISSTIAANALTYRLTPLPSAGSHIYHLVINAKGRNGNAVDSALATITVKIPIPNDPNPIALRLKVVVAFPVAAGDTMPTILARNSQKVLRCIGEAPPGPALGRAAV
jgi:hypothetical protein